MTIIDQFKNLRVSPIAQTIGQAFLVGWCVPIVTMVLPQFVTSDYVQAAINFWHLSLTNPAWLFLFFKATLNSGLSFTFGALMKTNAFDKFRQYFPSGDFTAEDYRKLPPISNPTDTTKITPPPKP